jgi:hypothetical protein
MIAKDADLISGPEDDQALSHQPNGERACRGEVALQGDRMPPPGYGDGPCHHHPSCLIIGTAIRSRRWARARMT